MTDETHIAAPKKPVGPKILLGCGCSSLLLGGFLVVVVGGMLSDAIWANNLILFWPMTFVGFGICLVLIGAIWGNAKGPVPKDSDPSA